MRKLVSLRVAFAGMMIAGAFATLSSNTLASEIGTAVDVDPNAVLRVSGSSRTIISGNRVSQGDVIQTSGRGQVQLLFDDRTRIVVGPTCP